MSLPIVLALLIIAGVAVSFMARRPHRAAPLSPAAERNRAWSRNLAARLPEAFKRIALPTVAAKADYEPVRYTSLGSVGDIGWAWRISTPGGATIGHVRERLSQLESACNRPTELVAVMDVQPDPVYEGVGTLRAYRRDPIHAVRPISEVAAPGEMLMRSPTGSMLCGVTRWAEHVRLPLWQHSAIVAGQTASGKSSGVNTILANVLPHVAAGTVRLHLVDVGKLGKGYHGLNRAGWFSSFETDPSSAIRMVEGLRSDLAKRTSIGDDGDVPVTRATPLEVLIIEEAPAFLPVKGAADALTNFARQVRQMGGVLIVVTQGGLEVPITLRRQLRTKVGFRLGDGTESRNVMDVASLSDSAPGPHLIPATTGSDGTVDWRGVSYVDPDGRGARMCRWWWVDDKWLAAHSEALQAGRRGA